MLLKKITKSLILLVFFGVLLAGCKPGQEKITSNTPDIPAVDLPLNDKEIEVSSDFEQAEESILSIDINNTQKPYSKYIYGQFIEHQGRCIYGGIWAEMLEDRKFYYPIGYKTQDSLSNSNTIGSPWYATGDTEAISMDKVDSYTGDITPKIKVSNSSQNGIAQSGLGLKKGEKYDGRIVLAENGEVKVKLSLIWGDTTGQKQTVLINDINSNYSKYNFSFIAGADTGNGILEISGLGNGDFKIGTISLMPADNVKGMRADTLKLLKELNAPIYRWPGGNFVNNYDWQKATGDRDKRPPIENKEYFSTVLESNDFGPDEFMTLLDLIDSEAYIAVSAMKENDAQMAAREVEYFNGGIDTAMGKLRASNGHKEPYNVKFWGVGNEMWAKMKITPYIPIHDKIALAMKTVDTSIKLIAVGGIGDEEGLPTYKWTETLLKETPDTIDLVGEHFYSEQDRDTIEHSKRLSNEIKRHVQAHRTYQKEIDELKGKNILVAIDEWNYGWGGQKFIYGEGGMRYYLRDAFGIARGLHELIRSGDIVYMANTQTINVLGGIKTTKTAAAFETTGLVMKLYGNHFGSLPININFNKDDLDVIAAMTEDGKTLTLAIVNAGNNQSKITLKFSGSHLPLPVIAKRLSISSNDPLAYNEPGKTPKISINTETISLVNGFLQIPKLSINIYKIPIS